MERRVLCYAIYPLYMVLILFGTVDSLVLDLSVIKKGGYSKDAKNSSVEKGFEILLKGYKSYTKHYMENVENIVTQVVDSDTRFPVIWTNSENECISYFFYYTLRDGEMPVSTCIDNKEVFVVEIIRIVTKNNLVKNGKPVRKYFIKKKDSNVWQETEVLIYVRLLRSIMANDGMTLSSQISKKTEPVLLDLNDLRLIAYTVVRDGLIIKTTNEWNYLCYSLKTLKGDITDIVDSGYQKGGQTLWNKELNGNFRWLYYYNLKKGRKHVVAKIGAASAKVEGLISLGIKNKTPCLYFVKVEGSKEWERINSRMYLDLVGAIAINGESVDKADGEPSSAKVPIQEPTTETLATQTTSEVDKHDSFDSEDIQSALKQEEETELEVTASSESTTVLKKHVIASPEKMMTISAVFLFLSLTAMPAVAYFFYKGARTHVTA